MLQSSVPSTRRGYRKKNEPPRNFPVSRFYPMFPQFFTTFTRFFTNKIFQGSQGNQCQNEKFYNLFCVTNLVSLFWFWTSSNNWRLLSFVLSSSDFIWLNCFSNDWTFSTKFDLLVLLVLSNERIYRKYIKLHCNIS